MKEITLEEFEERLKKTANEFIKRGAKVPFRFVYDIEYKIKKYKVFEVFVDKENETLSITYRKYTPLTVYGKKDESNIKENPEKIIYAHTSW